MIKGRKLVFSALALLLGAALILYVPWWTLIIPYCAPLGLERDLGPRLEDSLLPHPAGLLQVVMQPPWVPGSPRQREYYLALTSTLRHERVGRVHALAESVAHQVALYEAVPLELHGKMRTYNIHKRVTFADAVRYANLYLRNTTTLLCNGDVSVAGALWSRMTLATLRGHLFGLSRHEQPGCSMHCGCHDPRSTCLDTFAFVPPLLGGDEMLERISFRMGGLWGCEHRFLWEVKQFNQHLRISNPCKTFRTLHWHCVGKGEYRPTQDERRIDEGGLSIRPLPSRWYPE